MVQFLPQTLCLLQQQTLGVDSLGKEQKALTLKQKYWDLKPGYARLSGCKDLWDIFSLLGVHSLLGDNIVLSTLSVVETQK